MKYDHATRRELPPLPYRSDLVEIDAELVPYILAGLLGREKRFYWVSNAAAARGRQALAEQGAKILMGATNRLENAMNRLYTLLDYSLNGETYTALETGNPLDLVEYSPALPAAPLGNLPQAQSLRFSALETYRAVDNGLHGRDHTGYEDTRNPRQQLEDLIAAAGSAGELDDEMLAKLAQIALAMV